MRRCLYLRCWLFVAAAGGGGAAAANVATFFSVVSGHSALALAAVNVCVFAPAMEELAVGSWCCRYLRGSFCCGF